MKIGGLLSRPMQLSLPRRTDGSIGLMGHVIADYPSPKAVRDMVRAMADAGVAVIEIQIPFSEPMADGPSFLAANHAALAQGVGYRASLELMRELSTAHGQVQFLFMSYLNVIYRRGYRQFANEARAAGALGVIVPDLPVENAGELEQAAPEFANLRLFAPNADDQRLAELARGAKGLIYAVARAGVTGASTDFGQVQQFVGRIRALTGVPIAVGFGVRSPDDVRSLRGVADLAVIGSASLAAFQKGGLTEFQRFWRELSRASG